MRLTRTRRTLLAAPFAPLALPTPSTAHAAERLPARHIAGETVTLPVRDALATLAVSDEDRTGYTRDKFKHWIDADKAAATPAPRSSSRKPLVEQGFTLRP
ncbi:hypothetical protein ACFV2H_52595 [Streptomyces sp. NPDC059629]|uniref:hypothetical protein n=1 Tax=Streptomyces sp. NPDC059629 TaxID=3346889 RepID=UPI0036900FA0